MHYRARIVAGTALALVMAASQAVAAPQGGDPQPAEIGRVPIHIVPEAVSRDHGLLVAQAEDEEELTEEELLRRREAEREAQEQQEQQDQQEEDADGAVESVPDAPPAAEEAPPPADEEPAPPAEEAPAEPLPDEPPAEEAEPPAQEAPAEEPAPPATQEAEPPAEESAPPADGAAEPVPEEAPVQEAPAEQPEPPATQETEPAAEESAPPADDATEPVPGDSTPTDEAPAEEPSTEGGVEPAREAPILDSAKESAIDGEVPADTAAPVDAGPPPASDEEAQQLEEPVEVQSLRAEEGRRVERMEERRERPEGTSVLREIGDRLVIQLNNQVVVQSDDRGRIGHDASEVYYEELPRGRTRETVVRPNGVQIVTVYDRWGDVIRRSRIMPDGREHVLVWAGGRDRDERRQWRDPGLDLPPLRLTIPADEYTLDARRVRDERAYYDFLNRPPVEPVRRLYSIDEVRYSARVRDSVRRIELDTITFDFGSASISEDTIPLLSGVAHAMGQLLDENPAEVFLIEGHTDAVGSEEANLALSDRRAEGVATALTNVFGIPPENMVTQGYGKRYLKINTQEPERQNRRVVMRRITPLVAPVASAR